MQLVDGGKPKTRIQLREMRADSHTCALLGKKAAPGWTTAPKGLPTGWIRYATRNQDTLLHAKQVKSNLRVIYFASAAIPKQAASAWFAGMDTGYCI